MAFVNFKKQARLPVKTWIKRTWHVVDARDQVVGRLATKLATLVSGKHKPTYLPHIDDGDSVVVLNVDKVKFTGNKWAQKLYRTHSGYPGGLKEIPAWRMRTKNPAMILKKAVGGMLAKNSFQTPRVNRLKLYTGDTHPHVLQTGRVKVSRPELFNRDELPDFESQPWLQRFEPWEVQAVRDAPLVPEERWHKVPPRARYHGRVSKLTPREKKLYAAWHRLLDHNDGDEEATLKMLATRAQEDLDKAVRSRQ